MRKSIILAGIVAITVGAPVPGWSRECAEATKWKSAYPDVYRKVMSVFNCSPAGDPVDCNVFVGRAAVELYNIDDFKTADNSYLLANQIMDKVKSTPSWSKLPTNAQGVVDQALLNEAAQGAKEYMVIAVRHDEPHGHVALVLPGEPQYSPSWNLKVPNSASAFMDHVDQAYAFCMLSWAFSKKDGIEFWWKPRVSLTKEK